MRRRTGRPWRLLLPGLLLAACGVAPRDQAPVQVDQFPDTSVSFAFGADLAGQNVCRDLEQGFPIFRHVLAARPDFFFALGDMIYADSTCEAIGLYGNLQVPRATGIATTADEFRAHWRYVREDPAFSQLLREIPYFAVWDDHEVRNDFGPGDDLAAGSATTHLMPTGRSVFSEFNATKADRLYFSHSLGEQLEIFFLDTRSYRDLNSAVDDPAQPKTMLGNAQRRWLIEGVQASTARWKIIVSSVPLSVPTGWPAERGRDGWANFDQDTGFELELTGMLRHFADARISNLVFLTADVHFATGFRYRPFATHPDFVFHEFVTGPLQAGLFPNTALDNTLRPERLFYHAPASAEAVGNFADAQRWFNFGLIHIDANHRLRFTLVNGLGEPRADILLISDPTR